EQDGGRHHVDRAPTTAAPHPGFDHRRLRHARGVPLVDGLDGEPGRLLQFSHQLTCHPGGFSFVSLFGDREADDHLVDVQFFTDLGDSGNCMGSRNHLQRLGRDPERVAHGQTDPDGTRIDRQYPPFHSSLRAREALSRTMSRAASRPEPSGPPAWASSGSRLPPPPIAAAPSPASAPADTPLDTRSGEAAATRAPLPLWRDPTTTSAGPSSRPLTSSASWRRSPGASSPASATTNRPPPTRSAPAASSAARLPRRCWASASSRSSSNPTRSSSASTRSGTWVMGALRRRPVD